MEHLQVNHLDEDKTNNNLSNLCWMTVKENINYGTHNERMAKTLSKPIYCVELDRIFNSLTEAAAELNTQTGTICNCLKGRYKTAAGYHWEYIEEL